MYINIHNIHMVSFLCLSHSLLSHIRIFQKTFIFRCLTIWVAICIWVNAHRCHNWVTQLPVRVSQMRPYYHYRGWRRSGKKEPNYLRIFVVVAADVVVVVDG